MAIGSWMTARDFHQSHAEFNCLLIDFFDIKESEFNIRVSALPIYNYAMKNNI